MSIYKTGYDTTIGSAIVTRDIDSAIKEAFVRDMLSDSHLDIITSLDFKPVFITGAQESETRIPFFNHPYLIENYKGLDFLCTDIRPCVKNVHPGQYYIDPSNIRNQTEFNLVKSRAILNLAWLTNGRNQIRLSLNIAGEIFSGWISDVLSKNFALDPKDQLIIFIASLYYYNSLFFEDSFLSDSLQQSVALHTIKASKSNSQFVLDVFGKVESFIKESNYKEVGIKEFCEILKHAVDNVRLNGLSAGVLITLTGNSWYGLNAKEMMAVALEHPPTWCSIVHAALTERSYKHALISKVAERFSRGGRIADFTKVYGDLVNNYILQPALADRSIEFLLSELDSFK